MKRKKKELAAKRYESYFCSRKFPCDNRPANLIKFISVSINLQVTLVR